MSTLHNYVRACAPCFGQLNTNIDSPILRKYNYNYNNKYDDMLNEMGLNRSSTKEPKGQRARKRCKTYSTDPLLNILKTAKNSYLALTGTLLMQNLLKVHVHV